MSRHSDVLKVIGAIALMGFAIWAIGVWDSAKEHEMEKTLQDYCKDVLGIHGDPYNRPLFVDCIEKGQEYFYPSSSQSY